MATERTYDYDYLRRLFREHPDWSNRQYAQAVTMHERALRNDPGYPFITVHAIASTKYRYRDTWKDEGDSIPTARHDPTRRSQPFTNVPKDYQQSSYINALRILNRLASGESEGDMPAKKLTEARNLAKRLDNDKLVVDLRYNGEPYLRPARPDELDQEGNLVTYSAKFPGLDNETWLALGTPEARAAASKRWRHA